jgi:hypothetical protein
MSKRDTAKPVEKKVVRCAIYTRKSTEEGLQRPLLVLRAVRVQLHVPSRDVRDRPAVANRLGAASNLNPTSTPFEMLTLVTSCRAFEFTAPPVTLSVAPGDQLTLLPSVAVPAVLVKVLVTFSVALEPSVNVPALLMLPTASAPLVNPKVAPLPIVAVWATDSCIPLPREKFTLPFAISRLPAAAGCDAITVYVAARLNATR